MGRIVRFCGQELEHVSQLTRLAPCLLKLVRGRPRAMRMRGRRDGRAGGRAASLQYRAAFNFGSRLGLEP